MILKELKHSDGNFDETQRIELNAVKLKPFYVSFWDVTDFIRGFSLDCAAPANRLLQPDKVLWNSEVRAGCVWSV